MKLHTQSSLVKNKKRRIGRGHGSGRGKTAGRGTKGQKARGRMRLGFEGGQIRLIKRLPLLRGMGRNKRTSSKLFAINIKYLNILPPHSIVDSQALIKYHIIDQSNKDIPIKILGDGNLTIPLTVGLPVSKGAKKKIESAGGRVLEQKATNKIIKEEEDKNKGPKKKDSLIKNS